MYVFYDLLTSAADLAVAPALRLRRFQAHRERLGVYSPELVDTLRGRKVLWLHNASVGELSAARPLLRLFRDGLDGWRIVLSATSLAGRALGREVAEADGAVLLPLDFPACVARALDAIRPALFVFTETEIWPNLLRALRQRQVPAVLLSGRVSPAAFRRYRWVVPFMRHVLGNVSLFGMQSEAEAERIRALGAPVERVRVTGSLKLDGESPSPSPAITIAADAPLWIAASTHAGEEEACARAFVALRSRFATVRLLLAPRHLARLGEVEEVLRRHEVAFARRSALRGGRWSGEPSVLLLDTLGELAGLYGGAVAAFVGGTLAPVGGHNVVEPARAGVPVLVGPHIASVRALVGRLKSSGGAAEVHDAHELEQRLAALLADPTLARRMGEAARTTFAVSPIAEQSYHAALESLS
ncbi:MAG: glycosyltransferase N-terminal domain-containing protein [Candidatus Binatia bacterium]